MRWWMLGRAAVAAGRDVSGTVITGPTVVQVLDSRGGGQAPLCPRVFGSIPQPAWHFMDRPVENAALVQAAERCGRTAVVALVGHRGVGKSQLAAAYARHCVSAGFDLVAWINAEGSPVPGLALLAARLGLAAADDDAETAAVEVGRWLSCQRDGRRLLVLDDVGDPDTTHGFLPATGTTTVVLTSNRQEVSTMDGVALVPVSVFSPAEGIAMLHEATGLGNDGTTAAVGAELGWLPLGLAQAAATIVRQRWSYQQYLQALIGHDLGQALPRRAGAAHPGACRAIQLAVEGVLRDDPTGDAARLLTVLSLLAPEGVHRALLTRGEGALGLSGRLTAALDTLIAASLITLAGPPTEQQCDAVVVSVHRLTARIVRFHSARSDDAHLSMPAAVTTASNLLEAVTGAFPLTEVARRRAELDEIVAHIDALSGHAGIDPTPRLLGHRQWAGQALAETGDTVRAITLLRDTIGDRERVCGPDHADTLAARHALACAYQSAGRMDDAVDLHESVVADRERVLGAEHPDTLTSRHNLAYAYQSSARMDDAVALLESVHRDRARLLGREHPDTLTSRHNLASTYLSVGRLDDAVDLHTAVLADRERVLGAAHPDTLASRNNLAVAYATAGRLDDAVSLLSSVLAVRKELLGSAHPETLASRNNLAYIDACAGRPDDAVRQLTDVIADCERFLPPRHPTTIGARHSLAHAHRLAGRLDEAIRLLRLLLTDCERVHGPHHPVTRMVEENLTSATRNGPIHIDEHPGTGDGGLQRDGVRG